jgi:Zn finger protein HypA/HybF involved in hydrogenase expression
MEIIPIKGGAPMEAYCMKCRAKREMKDTKAITMKNGKPATQGVCPICGTKMFRIGKG